MKMNSQTSKESSSSVKVAVIGGLFVVLAACVSGIFLLLNTMLENGNVGILPVVTQSPSLVTPVVSQPTSETYPSPTISEISSTLTPTITSILLITDTTNNITHGFKIGEVADSSKYCPGAYLETGSVQINYKFNVPSSWVVIIDSWRAEWASGNYQNDGFLIITGEWEGTVKINTGAICGVPAEQAQTALQNRKSVTGFDGRPEFSIP